MGVLVAWLVAKDPQTLVLRAFLAVGILGAFTTFSTFSLDFVTLIERKEMIAAGGYLVASVLVSTIALVGGLAAGRAAL